MGNATTPRPTTTVPPTTRPPTTTVPPTTRPPKTTPTPSTTAPPTAYCKDSPAICGDKRKKGNFDQLSCAGTCTVDICCVGKGYRDCCDYDPSCCEAPSPAPSSSSA